MDTFNHLQPKSTSPKWRRPSEERMMEMDSILWDTHALRIYVDASPATRDKRVIGIAAAFVWGGNIVMRSRKYYERSPIHNANVLGEVVALLYGLTEIPSVIRSEGFAPERINVVTDYNVVVDWLETGIAPPTDFSNLVLQIKEQMSGLQEYFPSICVTHLGQERHNNPFYKAAHNRARQEVDTYSGRGGRRGR